MSSKPWEHAKSSGSEADALAARFVESLSYDTRLYDVDIRGSLAHARMLREVGLITAEDLSAIERGLTEIKAEIEAARDERGGVEHWPGWKVELEDVHMCIEAALIEKVGEPGRKLHTGRSRNDQVALDLRLWIREACGTLGTALDGLAAAFEEAATREGEAIIPSYTHLQRAQPIRASDELNAWRAMILKDRALLNHIAADPLGAAANPLGSGAIAGSALPLNRLRTTEALGFTQPTASSIEATASRDEALDLLYALSRIAMHLSRWAEQWIIYSSTEFGFIAIDDAYTTGSSMMPQKRNPDMLELIRGRAGGVYGHLVALLTICKGITIGYNRDLQEDKRHLFSAYDTVADCVEMARGIVSTVRFNAAHIAASLHRGYLDATCLAEYLVTRGVPFRTAHQIVGALVRRCETTSRHALGELSVQEIADQVRLAGADESLIGDDVRDWLGASSVVRRRRT